MSQLPKTDPSTSQGKWAPPVEQRRPGGASPASPDDGQAPQGPPPPLKKVRPDDVIFFASQLAVMVDTGVPLAEALDAIASECEHSGLKDLVEDITEQVKSGAEFSAALASHPKHFGTLFVSLVKASEASGRMGPMLERVCVYLAQQRDIRKRVQGAMAYPLAMLAFCTAVVGALLGFVMPRFRGIYEGKGAVLPWPTRILLGVSDAMVDYWPILAVLASAAVGGLWMYLTTPAGRRALDRAKIDVPLLGPMYRMACLARSFRTLSTMLTSGVGVLDGLEITAEVSGNCHYADAWRDVARKAEEGITLTDGLRESRLVPSGMIEMVAAGEKSGNLGPVMDRIATFCEEDFKRGVQTMTTLIEPAMIVIMGTIIGVFALALLLPVFSISRVIAN